MKNLKASFRLSNLVMGMLLLLSFPGMVNGQAGNRNQAPAPPGNPRKGADLRPASIRERQFRMLQMEREAAEPLPPEEAKLALAQIADDFKQLQIINNKMMAELMRSAEPKYVGIAENLGEIRKRAKRLKQNLGLSTLELEKTDKAEYKPAQTGTEVKTALLALDVSIMSFVNNSMFQNPEVVNLKEAAKARRDVDVIIETSQLITKDANRLSKSSSSTP